MLKKPVLETWTEKSVGKSDFHENGDLTLLPYIFYI